MNMENIVGQPLNQLICNRVNSLEVGQTIVVGQTFRSKPAYNHLNVCFSYPYTVY